MTPKQLVEKYGFGIRVKSPQGKPFKIISSTDIYYHIVYDDGEEGHVDQEHKTCQDYELLQLGDPK